tara:strand:+ start:1171 stop:1989 length:819 start_codon:yes stop_codon:yes gene_type:complete
MATATKVKTNWLKSIRRDVEKKPPVMAIVGPSGVGKSSLAGHVPGAIVMPFGQEDTWGLLKSCGAVPQDLPVLQPARTFSDVMGMLEELETSKHEYKALVIDTISCLERVTHEHVCMREFSGDWSEKGFLGFNRGYEVSLSDWRELINALDRLRDEKGMTVVLIGHTKIAPYRNPIGADYDRFTVDLHHKTWSLTHRWCDAVLFYNYWIDVDESGLRAKGKGGHARVIHTQHGAAFDAKNRFQLPAEIEGGDSGLEAWTNLKDAIFESRREK